MLMSFHAALYLDFDNLAVSQTCDHAHDYTILLVVCRYVTCTTMHGIVARRI